MPCYHYSYQQIKQLWLQNGGSPKLADIMAGIGMAESQGNTCDLNNNPNTGDYSVGIWQINYFGSLLGPRTKQYGAPSSLRQNPSAQAKAAIHLAGGDGSGLHNWTTYTSGKYKAYVGINKGGSLGIVGAAGSAIGNATGSASSAIGGAISSLNPISGIEGAIADFAMKFVYSLAIIGGGLLVLVGIILVGAELGIEQATGSKGGRLVTGTVGKVGPGRVALKAAESRGSKRGYNEGFGQGEMRNSDKELRASDRASAKQMKKDTRLPLKAARSGKTDDDIPF